MQVNKLSPFSRSLYRRGLLLFAVYHCFTVQTVIANQLLEVAIPLPQDWTDRGTILTPSGSGWETTFGAFAPAAVLKKDGKFFLYYVASSGPRSTDGGPRDRALGVATSTDGINFTKYAGNPVLTHQPQGNQEEGIVSAAATLDKDGNMVLYYGAIWAANTTTESVDVFINVAKSPDGFNFTDLGTIYKSSENGGENWPFAALHPTSGTATQPWKVWYGRVHPQSLLSGSAVDNLEKHGDVLPSISASWFGMQAVELGGDGKVAVFLDNPLEVWLIRLGSLDRYEGPLTTYNLPSKRELGLGILLDRDTDQWHMYFRSNGEIRLWTAPAKYVDPSKPSPPSGFVAE